MAHSTETLPVLIADRYQIVRQLGTGNMSTVYEALDHHASQRLLAIKLLDSQHAAGLKNEFFKRETRALERLEHPHIITLFDANWDPAQQCFYLALEYLPQTLTEVIQRHADDPDNAWCWPLMESLVDALVYAHSEGVIHRDLKSSNILIAADGTPKLTDFNISHLKFELSSGMTVGEFFSVGFASPEQLAHQSVTEKSDLYSLGCVFYHLLSRQVPPTEGITPERVRALHLHKVVEGMLLEVLANDPADRMPTALQLQRRLTALQNLTPPATIYVQVTQRARRELADKGFLNHNTNEAAAARLQQEFDDAAQVAVIHDGQETWRILTDQMQLLCGRDATIPMLIIKTIHFAYDPEQERLRAQATSARFAWQVIDGLRITQPPLASYPTAHATLNVFGEQLMSKAVARSTQRVQERARRDLVGTWQKVIAFQQQQLVKANRLRYTAFKKTGGTLTFTLRDLVPDDLDWPDSAPMGVFDDVADLRGVSIGEFLRVQGKEVQIAMNMLALGVGTGIDRLPATGWLGIYQQEVAVSLRRQKYALGVVRTGGTHNPDLPSVLLDVSTARFSPVETDLQFFQTHLGEDKRQAVRQALATQDIFILQGPPGTGKTTTLAEIVLQIRRRTPNARILISSQSNVATDHILSRVAAISGDALTEIVRIGRPQKIGQAAQEWTIDQRMVAWRESVLSRTTPVLAELKQRIATRRRLQQQATTFTEDYVADLEQCQLLLTDVDQEMAMIAELDRQCTAITTHAPRGKLTRDAQQAITERREAVAEHERSVRVLIDLILAYVPAELQPVLVGYLRTDVDQIKQMIAQLMQQETQDDDTALLTLVNRWRQVFGRTTDFAEPILARADIMAATCLTTGGHYFQDETFDWAIIDEAGRATAPELLVPLVRARRAILCGDERQLPPMLDDQLNPATLTQLGTSVEELGESLFAALAAQGTTNAIPAVQMLTAQHRMHPAIGRMVSAVFYEGLLTHAVQAHERVHQLPWISRPVIWYTTQHLPHHAETSVGKSFYNRAEVSGIHDLLLRMEESYREAGEQRELAIITPYQPQIAELTATIMPQSPLWQALDIEIATVDAFQGRDRDIVIYSTVRANETGNIGFLRDRRRLNVALSRARQLLVIVGDIVTLERAPLGKGGNPYRDLAHYLRDHPEDCAVLPLEGGAKR